MPDKGDISIAADAGSGVASILATIISIAYPEVGLALQIGKEGADFVSKYKARRLERQQRTLKNIVASISARVQHLEIGNSDEQADLFVEVVRKAVEDDEVRKHVFYECLLEWILKDQPTAAQVRVLSDAVKSLSYIEVAFFVLECNGRYQPALIEAELSLSAVVQRLITAGVTSGTVRINGSPTALGVCLTKYVQVSSVLDGLHASERRRLGLS